MVWSDVGEPNLEILLGSHGCSFPQVNKETASYIDTVKKAASMMNIRSLKWNPFQGKLLPDLLRIKWIYTHWGQNYSCSFSTSKNFLFLSSNLRTFLRHIFYTMEISFTLSSQCSALWSCIIMFGRSPFSHVHDTFNCLNTRYAAYRL